MVIDAKQRTIQKKIDISAVPADWTDWQWHVRHAVRSLDEVERLLQVRVPDREQVAQAVRTFPLSITPYYLSLIDTNNIAVDPVFRQAIPQGAEVEHAACDMQDPLAEDKDSPVECLAHRYPDRVLLTVSNVCAMYCRFCTRKRKVGDRDRTPSKKTLLKAISYIRSHRQIRDVLLSGGDPFLLSDGYLEWILQQLRTIRHVEIIRIGTRTPVVLPFRITEALVGMLKKYHPVWVNTHFNHPCEVTASSARALARLADAGIPLGNQSVLLAGINDCPRIMKYLLHRLLQNRVRPYYLYQCDLSEGLAHFRTPVGKGIEILENLIGHTTGMAVPTYVIDAPGGGGKIPVMPNYLISWSTNKVILRNYEGVITTYKEPDSYKPVFCNRKCDVCTLQLPLNPATEERAVGISRLIADYEDAISLTPEGNQRLKRRRERQNTGG